MTNPFGGGHTSGFHNPDGTTEDFKKAHNKSDTDSSASAIHHTLGKKSSQAAPGDHSHWVTGDVKHSYAPADNIHWFELNGQPSPTAALTALFGANLPDVRDRFIIGSSGTKAPGATGGSSTKTLTEANLAAHDHSIAHTHTMAHTHGAGTLGTDNPGNHTHDTLRGTAAGGSGNRVVSANTTADGVATSTGAGGHTHTLSGSTAGSSAANTGASSATNSGSTGSGTAFDVMNPWHAMRVLVYSE